MTLLCLPMMTACSDDDDTSNGDGQPVITVQSVSPAMFGDSITLQVNCKDDGGVALSTLKTSLMYSEETVQTVTTRTKENGDYQVKLFVPFYQNVPDGTAKLKFVLQNIHFTTAEQTVDLALTRPHYSYLTLKTSDNKEYRMTPDADNPYLFRTSVSSPDSKTVLGYVIAPAADSNGKEITFGQGTNGITDGTIDNISFASTHKGTFECTFNVLTYEYSPVYDPATAAQEIVLSESANTYDGELVQGRNYEFTGLDVVNSGSWFYDSDFFTSNGDGTYKFNAVTGYYHIKANLTRNGFQIWATNADKSTASLASDGSGALWIIGDDGIGKPAYSFISGQGWWTDTDHALCLAQVKDKVYQITLTAGKQLRGSSINFKFFGQAGWGIEFHGAADTYHVSSTSDVFLIGDGNGHDNGNLYLPDGTTLTNGDTYVLTVDLTQGCSNGVLTATKK